MSRGYRLTEGSVRSINATIRTVNQMRKTGIAGDLPFRQNAKRQPAGATLQIGKTKADQAWAINTEATLDLWKRNADGDMEAVTKEDGTQMTFTAFNCFASIEADKFVGCLNGFLISAEC